jgi:hypothetical protein
MYATTWLPTGWQHPTKVALPTGHHLRPIRASDVDLDMRAVMGSQERLWAMYGGVWGWPPADLTVELHRQDLARYEAETERGLSFHYALFDSGETDLMGRLTIEPSTAQPGEPTSGEPTVGTADVSWWVVDWLVGGPIEAALDAFVPEWISTAWPLARPRYQPARGSAAEVS